MEEQGIREGPPPSGDRIICRTSLITEHLHLSYFLQSSGRPARHGYPQSADQETEAHQGPIFCSKMAHSGNCQKPSVIKRDQR